MTFQRAALYHPTKKLMFVCDSEEQHDVLSHRGWTSLPDGYKPDEAQWVDHFSKVPADETKPSKGEPKPARTVGADTDGDGKIDKPFAGRKGKKAEKPAAK